MTSPAQCGLDLQADAASASARGALMPLIPGPSSTTRRRAVRGEHPAWYRRLTLGCGHRWPHLRKGQNIPLAFADVSGRTCSIAGGHRVPMSGVPAGVTVHPAGFGAFPAPYFMSAW